MGKSALGTEKGGGMKLKLSDTSRKFHHVYRQKEVFYINLTFVDECRIYRKRYSLQTKDPETALRRRDRILKDLEGKEVE